MPSERATQLEIRSAKGDLLLTIAIGEGNGTEERKVAKPPREPDRPAERRNLPEFPPQAANAVGSNAGAEATSEPMTEAQKRFLFRLLAERGIEGDKAYEHLKKLFEVEALKNVSKLEASRRIESLLEDAKGGGRKP